MKSGNSRGTRGASRREFVVGLAALGAGVFIPGCASDARQTGLQGKPRRIDVHHHYHPPRYMTEVAKLAPRETTQAGWTVAKSLDDMDRSGIATAVLSLTQPQVWFGDVAIGRRLTRECNDFGAQLVRDHPGRFGLFATLPIPDTEGSLRAIEHGLDTLKADGITLMTSYGNQYLGDKAFWPVSEELNRRKAVIYTHPLTPACCANPLPGVVRDSSIELGTDTTRTIASVLFTGTAARFPDIRWIFSHAGGAMPYLYQRFLREEASLKNAKVLLPNGMLHEVKKFYYDAAQAAQRSTLSAFLTLVPVSQLMVGSDFPARPGAEVVAGLTSYGFSATEMEAIDRGTALKLLPGLKG